MFILFFFLFPLKSWYSSKCNLFLNGFHYNQIFIYDIHSYTLFIFQGESDDDLEELEKSIEEDPDYDPNDSFHQLSSPKKEKLKKSNLSVVQELPPPPPTFSVAISIDRALHLPHIVDKSRYEYMSNRPGKNK